MKTEFVINLVKKKKKKKKKKSCKQNKTMWKITNKQAKMGKLSSNWINQNEQINTKKTAMLILMCLLQLYSYIPQDGATHIDNDVSGTVDRRCHFVPHKYKYTNVFLSM